MINIMIENIAKYASLKVDEMINLRAELDGDCYAISFDCDNLHYDCYVDLSGEIMGFMFSPIDELAARSASFVA